MPNKSRVFVIQENEEHDLSPARKFGQLELLLPRKIGVSISPAPDIAIMRKKLAGFCSDDFILLDAGDPLLMGLAISVAIEMNNGIVTALKWMKPQYEGAPCSNCERIMKTRPKHFCKHRAITRAGDYFPVKIDFYNRG